MLAASLESPTLFARREPMARPQGIALAHEADFPLGALIVCPSTREVARGDWISSLEPRVMQVLVALHQAQGAVVSRDDLIARCWSGRIVGDDAISRAMGQLRRLSKADHGRSFGIETIPRVGYRLRLAAQDIAPAPQRGWRQAAMSLLRKLVEG